MPPKRKAAAVASPPLTTPISRPKRAAAQKASRPAAAFVGDNDSNEEDAPSKKKARKAKGKGKVTSKDDEKDNKKDDDKKDIKQDGDNDDDDKKKMVTIVKRGGGVPVDHKSGKTLTHQVVEAAGYIWDATLNQTNVNRNNNKFYIIQLLRNLANPSQVELFTRWGRVGDDGQTQTKGPFNEPDGITAFKKQFMANSGVPWEYKREKPARAGKYAWIERDHDDTSVDSSAKAKVDREEDEVEEPEPDCTLHEEVKGICQIIFSTKLLSATLTSMNYDANKAPLGKLAKSTILKGFETLKELSQVLDDPNCATAKQFSDLRTAYAELTNRYYSVIPHAFGRRVPTIIDSKPLLKQELELVDALGDMQIASKLISSTHHTDSEGKRINTFDYYFKSLNLVFMEPVLKDSDEFKAIERYTYGTRGKTHHFDCLVESIFRVERAGEASRWQAKGYSNLVDGERMLLWHGSRATNFAGILSQGLRIAPPEAPVSGYMFGKGVYFADMMSKSAGYTYYHISNNTALMLLCEVAVRPFHELKNADYCADQACASNKKLATKGVGKTAPTEWQDAGEALSYDELKGCHIPKGNPSDINPPGAYLQYNEYVVYDVSQIRLRYLLRIKIT